MAASAIRRTPEWLAQHQAKQAAQPLARADAARQRFQALGRLPKGTMNKTEAAYAQLLEAQRQAGLIHAWAFHPMNIRLAKNAFYEVDFLVVGAGLRLEIHEVKGGYTTDKGQLKIKLCAETLPWFRFLKVSRRTKAQGGGWSVEEY